MGKMIRGRLTLQLIFIALAHVIMGQCNNNDITDTRGRVPTQRLEAGILTGLQLLSDHTGACSCVISNIASSGQT